MFAQHIRTISEVAEGAGISRVTVHKLYHHQSSRVDFATLNALCQYLDCQPGDLLVYTPDTP